MPCGRSQRPGPIRTSTRRYGRCRLEVLPLGSTLGSSTTAYLYSIVVPVRAATGHLERKNGPGRKREEAVCGILDPGLLQLRQKRMSGRVHLWWRGTNRGTGAFVSWNYQKNSTSLGSRVHAPALHSPLGLRDGASWGAPKRGSPLAIAAAACIAGAVWRQDP